MPEWESTEGDVIDVRQACHPGTLCTVDLHGRSARSICTVDLHGARLAAGLAGAALIDKTAARRVFQEQISKHQSGTRPIKGILRTPTGQGSGKFALIADARCLALFQ